MPKSVLVADDSITMRKVIGMVFATEDFTVTMVDNGVDAIAKAREIKPDLVIADCVMPGRTGYDVAQAVRGDPAIAQTPVLLLAGSFEPFDESRARASGATAHIAKPFDSQSFMDRVRALVGMAPGAAPISTVAPVSTGPAPMAKPAAAAPPTGIPMGTQPGMRSPLMPPPGPGAPPGAPMPRPPGVPMGTQSGIPRPPMPPGVGVPPGAPMPRPPTGIPMGTQPGMRSPMMPPGPPGPMRPPMPPGMMPPGAPMPRPPMQGMPRPPMPGPPMPGPPMPGQGMPPPGMPGQPMPPHGMPGQQMPPPHAMHPHAMHPQGMHPQVMQGRRDPFGLSGPLPPGPMPQRPPMPGGMPEASADGGEAQLRQALSLASKEVIEKIAWEVVPQLAETIIREELERLMKDREAKGLAS